MRLLPILLLVLLAILLASCGPAMQAPATEAPAAAPSGTEGRPAADTALPPQAEATLRPTQAVTNAYLVELEYPEDMRLGDSDVIVVSLFNTESGYTIEAEYVDHTIATQDLIVETKPGYRTFASGELAGAGFQIDPAYRQEYEISQGESITWRWSITPASAGRQRLSLVISLIWIPETPAAGPQKTSQLFSRGIEIRVSSLFGLPRSEVLTSGFIGLFFGTSLGMGALLWRRKGQVRFQSLKPNPRLVIETSRGIRVSQEQRSLLKALFQRYQRLILTGDFLSGYSGARTFLALPVRAEGQADAATIVKIGQRAAIEREVGNYNEYVKDRLPPITARIQQDPVALSGGDLAAVQYTFITKSGELPVSLRTALLKDPDPVHIQRLYETFGPGWWMQREPHSFQATLEYDRLLPPHLVLEPLNEGSPARLQISSRDAPGSLSLKAGELVRVGRFDRFETRADGQSLTLTGRTGTGQTPLRLRWLSTTPPANSPARVVATREKLLHDSTRGLSRAGYADPLEKLSPLLDEVIQGTRSIIHGDLNLENILVGPGQLVWMIDFAETRRGHTLFDFAKLKAEVIGHVVASLSADERGFERRFLDGQLPLLTAIDQVAANCLFNPNKSREYEMACLVAFLGALKYRNLSPSARQHLYLAASIVAQRL